MRFGIIGAGMAGLACADALREAGHCVALFDKGRAPGGRMSTRRIVTPLGEVAFDHGAQYFNARDPDFRRLVDSWSALGIAAPWPQAGADAWVGMPAMNDVIRHMAAPHDVAWDHPITGMARRHDAWRLTGKGGESGPYDAVILAIPAEQAAAILSLHDFPMARIALVARSQPCWTGLFAFERQLECLPPILRDEGGIAWAARNSDKPGRTGPEAWVVQASAAWSAARLEAPQEHVSALLLVELARAAGTPLPEPLVAASHRWRFALSAGTGDGALCNPEIAFGVCGDWLLGPRVECAWLSGRILAAKIISAEKLLPVLACPKGHVSPVKLAR